MASIWESEYDIRGQGHRRFYGTTYPTNASDCVGFTPQPGDFIWNTAPGLGGVIGWMCVAAGQPGTWVEVSGLQGLGFTLTTAQIEAMNGAPIVLVAAQGAGMVIEVESCLLEYIYGGTAFQNGGNIGLFYGTTAAEAASGIVANTFLNSPTANQMCLLLGSMASELASTFENQPLVISNGGGAFTAGNGSIVGRLKFRVHAGLT